MTEAEARDWIESHVPRETIGRLEALADMVILEASRQNLIAVSTIESIWSRHIVDSAQLAALGAPSGRWLDLGSGAGFPGLVIGLIGLHDVVLVESRAKRAQFLQKAVAALGLTGRVAVRAKRIETLASEPFDIISARAFAPLDRLFATAVHLSTAETRWLLPKGRGAKAELDAVQGSWQGNFAIVASITDPDAAIIVADQVHAIRDGRPTGSRR